MKKMFIVAIAFVGMLGLCLTASASVVSSDDFESDTIGAAPADAQWINTPGLTVESNIAGFGSGSQHAQAVGGAGSFAFVDNDGAKAGGTSTIMTTSFDLYYNSDANNDAWIRMQLRNDPDTGFVNRFDIIAGGNDITLANFGVNQSYEFDVVYNASGATLSSYFMGADLPNNNYHVWIDNTLVGGDRSFDGGAPIGGTDGFGRLGMWVNGGTDGQTVLYDNLQFNDAAVVANVVPEPSSLALLGLFGLAGIVRRKRA